MKGLSPEETRDLIISVGTHRSNRRLQPSQVSMLLNNAIESGETIGSISDQLNLSNSVIRSFLSLSKLPENIQSLIGWGSKATSIAFSSAIEISRLDTPHEMEALAKHILEMGLSLKDVTQIVQIYKRSDKDIDESVETVLNLQVEYEKRHLIIGEILSQETISFLGKLDIEKRNLILLNALLKYGLGVPTYGYQIQGQYFSLVVDETYYRNIISLGEDIEGIFTNILENAIEELI